MQRELRSMAVYTSALGLLPSNPPKHGALYLDSRPLVCVRVPFTASFRRFTEIGCSPAFEPSSTEPYSFLPLRCP